MHKKVPENVDGIEDDCVWTCSWSFCQIWLQYMWWDVNILKSGPKVSDEIKRHDTRLNLFNFNGTFA